MTSTKCGTPQYIAPEVITNIEYGAESDFWAIGVIAFALLSGEMPFTGEDQLDLLDSITECDWSF